MTWRERFASTRHSPDSAIALIPRGKHIFLGSGAAIPAVLVQEMVRQAHRFSDNQIQHIMTLGDAPYVEAGLEDRFRHNAFFIGKNVRDAVNDGRADYTPVFLSQVPELIRHRRLPVDVALIQVSPPDEYGFVNLGVSVDVILAALDAARLVVAQVNEQMPIVHGAGFFPMSRIDAWVEASAPLPTLEHRPRDGVDEEIGRHVATLVEDGSTIQVGIGALPEAILASLRNKKDLGVWTEMVSDGVIDLLECGAVTGKNKTMHPGRVSASFALGSTETYRALHRNPTFSFHPTDVINAPGNIGRQHRMVAINGALQVDLTGQVCSDSIGARLYSGIGGQVDFIRGASMCPGGRPIIALRSTALDGSVSRIVSVLEPGAGVVTSRGDVHYVVTEHGVADLHGRSVRDRALALISIAHPDVRSTLLEEAKARHYVFADQIAPRANYPFELQERDVSKDGIVVLIRPIRETDEGKISDMFYSLSDETVQRRYLAPMTSLPHHQLMRDLTVDDHHDVALVIETEPRGQEESEIVGVGRYHSSPDHDFADVALLIRDNWQGRGFGKKLFQRLTQMAKGNGVRKFRTEVLASNRAMLRIFRESGHPVRTERDGMTVSVDIDLSDAEAGRT